MQYLYGFRLLHCNQDVLLVEADHADGVLLVEQQRRHLTPIPAVITDVAQFGHESRHHRRQRCRGPHLERHFRCIDTVVHHEHRVEIAAAPQTTKAPPRNVVANWEPSPPCSGPIGRSNGSSGSLVTRQRRFNRHDQECCRNVSSGGDCMTSKTVVQLPMTCAISACNPNGQSRRIGCDGAGRTDSASAPPAAPWRRASPSARRAATPYRRAAPRPGAARDASPRRR